MCFCIKAWTKRHVGSKMNVEPLANTSVSEQGFHSSPAKTYKNEELRLMKESKKVI